MKEEAMGTTKSGEGIGKRAKTDLRLPRLLIKAVEAVCYALGIPKNAFFALGAARLALKLAPLIPGRKRGRLVQDLEKIVLKTLDEAKKAL